MFKNMLVAYDGSPYSEKALEAAMRFLSQDAEVKLHVLNVMDALSNKTTGLYGPGLTATMFSEYEEKSEQLLNQAQDLLVDYEKRCSFYKVKGNPAEEIVDAADELDIDLIIMGSRGLGAVKGLMLGSVSSRVLQQAKCNVLVVK